MSQHMSAPAGAVKTLQIMSDVEEGRAPPQALGAWVSASPENLSNVLLLALPQDAAKGFSRETRLGMEALLSTRDVATPEWAPPRIARTDELARSRVTRPMAWGLAAAFILGTVAGVLFFSGGGQWQRYQTAVGQSLAVNLDDGSELHLNTATDVEVRLTRKQREVRILHGEARFDVNTDVQRPFLVQAGAIRVRTLGTEFDVYRASMHTDVAVSKGAIAVSFVKPGFFQPRAEERRINHGMGLRLRQDGSASDLAQADFLNAVDWPSGRMRFLNESLSRIADEFNRYNDEPKIDVQGDAASKRFSGVFVTADPDAFTALISADPTYEVVKQGRKTVIRLRPK